jgi:tRNA-2-methylthio-N6-dimethylallyladenosine synthase
MNRTYDREWFKTRLDKIREVLPNCGVSTDVITGFCTETEEEHQDTLSMFAYARFNFAYMYAYSERPGTLAARRYADDIPADVKNRRLQEIINLQNSISKELNAAEVGKTHTVLIEGDSKKSSEDWMGRNDQNVTCIFPKGQGYGKGSYVKIMVERSTQTSLIGKVVEVLAKP